MIDTPIMVASVSGGEPFYPVNWFITIPCKCKQAVITVTVHSGSGVVTPYIHIQVKPSKNWTMHI